MKNYIEIQTNAPSRQIKVLSGSANVFVSNAGSYGRRLQLNSTDGMNMERGYCPLLQHKRDGEYVFAFERATCITAQPIAREPETVIGLDEPFSYIGFMLSGVYAFQRTRKGIELVSLSGAAAQGGAY